MKTNKEILSGVRRDLGAAKDLVRRIDAAIGSLGERHGLRGALSHRYFERARYQDRSLDRDRSVEKFLIALSPTRQLERKQE